MGREGDPSAIRYVLALGLTMGAVVLGIGLVLMIFTNIGSKYGLGAALLVIGGGLLLFGWYWDRKHPRLPPV